jgi:predicted dehydrogenase
MIKAAIIGCGKIADQHAEIISGLPDCEIVAFCDNEPLMARQMAERFNVSKHFSDAKEMLESVNIDVVHITTPPQSHFPLAQICLEAGCNVYVEKPFTVNTADAEALIQLATSNNLKITVGHNAQFSPAAIRMRQLVKDGFLGGKPIHIESYYCYDFGDARYAKAFLSDKTHWLRSLPGTLTQNIISHGVCKIAEFLTGDNPTVIANGFISPLLKGLNETQIIDELRVIINDNEETTAYFTFSSQMKPVLHQCRIYGPKNALIIDDDNQTLIKIRGNKYKSYVNHFVPPFTYARQYMANGFYNINRFLKRDFHMGYGMQYLIKAFYQSITDNSPLPISYKEILLTSKIMDSIFEQIKSNH